MGVQFELRSMVDQALGCPDKGIVNFNVLHGLLHQILNLLDNRKGEKEDSHGVLSEDKLRDGREKDESSNAIGTTVEAPLGERSIMSSSSTRWNDIDQRLNTLESKFEMFNNLPTDQSIIDDAAQARNEIPRTEGSSENTLAMMWKFMTITRRVQATEEAVDKIMDILNGLLGDISELKNLRSDIEKLQEMPMERNSGDALLPENLKQISEMLKKMESRDNVVSKNDLLQFVTWSALEQALNKEVQGVHVGRKEDSSGDPQTSPDRPGTAPVPSEAVSDSGGNVPPKTAMSPKEFEKLTGQAANFDGGRTGGNDVTTDKTQPLSSKENSFGEVSLGTFDDKDGQLSCDNPQESCKPSPQLITQLSRIGELPKQYDDVAVQVSNISELQSKLASDVHKVEVDILPQKVDKEELNLPDNLLEQIEMLKEGLDSLTMNQDIQMLATIKATTVQNKENLDNLKKELGLFSQHLKRIDQPRVKSPESNAPGYDQEVLNSVRDKLKLLQEEQEKTTQKNKEDVARLLENLDEKQRLIDDLVEHTEKLQEGKADRENVATEMNVKADKHALENKVNQSTFEETFEMFDRGLQDALQKMEDYLNEEMSLKDTLSRISQEMEGKIDNDSLNLMKDYFEKQIKEVQESRNQIARETHVDPSNAAGIRRKLPIHYHCISCDRPVELTIKDSEPTLPGNESLPVRRLKFPFTSYEVEQLRQKSAKGGYPGDDSPTLRELLSGRPCGGSHTVINPQLRRSTKLHQFNQTAIARDDVHNIPKMAREVSVLDFLRGSDGHYYKGRTKQVLPSIPKRPLHSTTQDQKSVYKAKQNSPEQWPSEQNKGTFRSVQRTPSPPAHEKYVDDLSSSYPEESFTDGKNGKNFRLKRYSCDDMNVPSTTFNNSESIKVLQNRRRRIGDKDIKSKRCWDSVNGQKDTKDKTNDFDKPISPKSIKRTTPVGQEETYVTSDTSPQEIEPQEQPGQNGTAEDMSRTSDGTKK